MKKCICKINVIVKDKQGVAQAISKETNYSWPRCFPELNCENHQWESGGFNKKSFVIFCKNCGKTDERTFNR